LNLEVSEYSASPALSGYWADPVHSTSFQ